MIVRDLRRITLLVLIAGAALADRPAPPRDYTITSTNGLYQFRMAPAPWDATANAMPMGEASRVSDGERLWSFQGWYSHSTFLANDGSHLVRTGPWASLPPEEELAVAFYRDGVELSRFVVADLVNDSNRLERSVSHYTWVKQAEELPALDDELLFKLITVENVMITFDVLTGSIVDRVPLDRFVPVNAQVTREQADDTFFAGNLLKENGVEFADADVIERVIRGNSETVVWIDGNFDGLPVFNHLVGYTFNHRRQVVTRTDSDEPAVLGRPVAPRSAFPIDHRPDVTRDTAIATYYARLEKESIAVSDFQRKLGPAAVLGFYNFRTGMPEPPEYRLVWRVRAKSGDFPVTMISAKKGDILLFDSGIREDGPEKPR